MHVNEGTSISRSEQSSNVCAVFNQSSLKYAIFQSVCLNRGIVINVLEALLSRCQHLTILQITKRYIYATKIYILPVVHVHSEQLMDLTMKLASSSSSQNLIRVQDNPL